jgi:hypothetical protein
MSSDAGPRDLHPVTPEASKTYAASALLAHDQERAGENMRVLERNLQSFGASVNNLERGKFVLGRDERAFAPPNLLPS